MLAHVVGECWHALVRDVIALGLRPRDIFTTLTLADMVSIVVAAPPGTSVRWYLDKGWNRTDHILANMAEQGAGIARLQEPYSRPGLEQRKPDPLEKAGFFPCDVLTWEEADRRDKIRYSGKFKHGAARSRALSAVRGVG